MSKLDELIKKLCPYGVRYRKIGEICDVFTGGEAPNDCIKGEGKDAIRRFPVYSNGLKENALYGYSSTYVIDKKAVTFSSIGTIGHPEIRDAFFTPIIRLKVIIPKDDSYLNLGFLKYALEIVDFNQQVSSVPNINSKMISDLRIPVPPIEVQNEIVRILDAYSNLSSELTAKLESELLARKIQYKYYRDQLLSLNGVDDSEIRRIRLGQIGKVCMCKRIMKDQTSSNGEIPFYKIGTFGKQPDSFIPRKLFEEYKRKYSYPKKGEILISCSGTIGRTVVFDGEDAYFQDSNIVWIKNDESLVLNSYLRYLYQLNPFIISTGGTISRLYNDGIERAEVIIPSIKTQISIIEKLNCLEAAYNSILAGLFVELDLSQKQYKFYRKKLLSFKELSK